MARKFIMDGTLIPRPMGIEYCPLCGGKFSMAKWQHNNSRCQTLICPLNHLWDLREHSYIKDGLEFTPVSLSKCECSEVMPTRDMRDIDKRKVCPKCFEVAQKAWRMDKEKSYARLEILPIKTGNMRYYQLNNSIEISPYPNPFMYGAMYGGNSAKDEQELEQAIKSFNETVAKLKENGLERVEIVRHDELIRIEQLGLEGKATNKPVTPIRTTTPAASKTATAKTKEPAQQKFF